MNSQKLFRNYFGREPKNNYDHILMKGFNESFDLIKNKGYSEGILAEVGNLLKKHGANVILTGVVLNIFRKLFGASSFRMEKIEIKDEIIKDDAGRPEKRYFLYDVMFLPLFFE